MKQIRIVIITILIIFQFRLLVYANELELTAQTAIMIEEASGKLLYAKAENEKIYPASMTKMLTALIVVENLEPDEIIIVGKETLAPPSGSSLAKHVDGEAISVKNLLRGLLIVSGNDSACILAKAVITKLEGEQRNYQIAEEKFSRLMNEKVKEIGATDSNFVNPHGFHDDNHYTTAKDMSLIAKAAIANPLIRQIVAEKSYEGPGVENNDKPNLRIKQYKWTNSNLLLNSEEYGYTYATGIKTGFTNQATHCLAASAVKGDIHLITIVYNSPEPQRWIDTKNLFEYGFENFGYVTIQKKGIVLDNLELENYQLGEKDNLNVFTDSEYTTFINFEQAKSIKPQITYNKELIAPKEEANQEEQNPSQKTKLLAPIAKNQIVGKIEYLLDGEVIYKANLLAQEEVLERTSESDFNYYFKQTKDFVFSINALPYWIALFIIIIIAIYFVVSYKKHRKRKRRLQRRRKARY